MPSTSLTRSVVPLLLLTVSCSSGSEPAVSVAGVDFEASRVEGLAPEQLEQLADLAAVGRAVADGTLDSLVSPLVSRDRERARLAALPYHLGALRMGLGERALQTAYEDDPDWELTVRHLVRLVPRWAGATEREEARAIAESAAARARAGEDFSRLAAELSAEPGAAERGGLLQPGREGSWVTPFWAAARALEVGEASGVVETEYGYHVLMLESRRPVPFSEASRLPLLQRLVPRSTAVLAMEQWAATRPPVSLDEERARRARQELLGGGDPDTLVLAGTPDGTTYTGGELVLSWIALPGSERDALRAAGEEAFLRWVEDDAREAIWAAAARQAGAEAPPAAGAAWVERVGRPAAGAGFRPNITDGQIAAVALAAVTGRGQEARIAREELAPLRPLLRRAYPAELRGVGAFSAASSSSEIRNMENTL